MKLLENQKYRKARHVSTRAIKPFIFSFLIYIIISTGIIFPDTSSKESIYVSSLIFAYFVLIIIVYRIYIPNYTFGTLFLLLISVIFYYQYPLSQNEDIYLDRLNGGFLSTVVLYILIYNAVRDGVDKFLDTFLAVSMLFIIITLFFKINYGFFDRGTRFFINGPIVFSWICGVSLLISLYMYIVYRKFRYILLMFVFLLGMLWSQSKGPIVALSIPYVYILTSTVGLRRSLKYIIVPIVFFLVGSLFFPDALRRFDAIGRLLTGELGERDYGSIGVRLDLWAQTLVLMRENWLHGVGMTNWGLYATDSGGVGTTFTYPHNIILEMGSEFGIPVTLIMLTMWGLLMRRSRRSSIAVAISIFGFICLNFSGNMSYIRFILAFPLAFSAYHYKNRAGK